jgi:glutamate formiminotransferase / formiminotetrahydrofolate cyclodeaminase
MKQIIECVPNFSEGRDPAIIKQITDVIEGVNGIRLLNVDPGFATNRTVVTFVGEPEQVVEAAFRSVKLASELIDMRFHKGEHPRFGATDVCPLVPVSNITMEETVEYARHLANRVGNELNIPVYCYEFAAYEEKRRSLANCRAGEYEGLAEKMKSSGWQPDYGPSSFNARSGATAIGARNFLIAYNINLNTTSVRLANSIAFDVREAGRVKREGDPITGRIIKDETGEPVRIPGTLKKVRAIGWFIKEYGIAQISINLTDITTTSVHNAFNEVCEKARDRGIRVTGSELIGMVPLEVMLDAGRYFLQKQHRSVGIPDSEIIEIAVKSLGLNELSTFDPGKRIIEYVLADDNDTLIDMKLAEFVRETASDSPAPGGGSVAACVGALGAALGTMVANLTSHKRGYDNRWEEFSEWAEKGKIIYEELLRLIDQDTLAFNMIMEAFKLPKETKEEVITRKSAVQSATKNAIEIPFRVMQLSYQSMEVIEVMSEIGNPNSVTDAGVGALCALASVSGAYLNVMVNASSYDDKDAISEILTEAASLDLLAKTRCEKIQTFIRQKLGMC